MKWISPTGSTLDVHSVQYSLLELIWLDNSFTVGLSFLATSTLLLGTLASSASVSESAVSFPFVARFPGPLPTSPKTQKASSRRNFASKGIFNRFRPKARICLSGVIGRKSWSELTTTTQSWKSPPSERMVKMWSMTGFEADTAGNWLTARKILVQDLEGIPDVDKMPPSTRMDKVP